jgi:CHAT domain-containing protein/tetratricopeptide (TPR) repeat protein
MPSALLFALILSAGLGLCRDPSPCPSLDRGELTNGVLSSLHPSCFSFAVAPREAIQFVVTQPEDLAIHLTGNGAAAVMDGFDFGNETLTVKDAGVYRMELVFASPPASPRRVQFLISRKIMEPDAALAWNEAERWATVSKASRAKDDIAKSLALWENLGETSSVARTWLKEGNRASRSGDPASAAAAHEHALAVCLSIPDLRCVAEAENNAGVAARQLGNLEAASTHLDEAARDWRKLAMRDLEARTLSNLGLLHWQSGDFEQAMVTLNKALKTADPLARARVRNNLGLCRQSLADYDRAAADFRSAIGQFETYKSARDAMRARVNLGRTYMLQEKFTLARNAFEQALSAAMAQNDRRARADALRNLGQDLWRMGDLAGAADRLEEALAVDRADGDPRGESAALHYLGAIAGQRGQIENARDLLDQAARIRTRAGLSDDAADSLEALARLEYRAGNWIGARARAEEALSVMEAVRGQAANPALRASYYARRRKFFDLLVDLAMEPGNPGAPADTLLAAERGRARSLMDMLADGALLRQLPPDQVRQRLEIQRRINYFLALVSNPSPNQPANLRDRLEELVDKDRDLAAGIRRSLAGQKFGRLASIDELQKSGLPADSALLEYHLGDLRSYLWLVTRDEIRVFPLPGASLIEAQARTAVRLFSDPASRRQDGGQQAYRRAMDRLSATLLGPLAGRSLPRRIVLAPDGVLLRVPFAAVPEPGTHRPLGLAHDLLQVPAASYLLAGRTPRPVSQFPKTIMTMSDPVFSPVDSRSQAGPRPQPAATSAPGLARLPFRADLDVIESLVPETRRKTFRGFDASVETLRHLSLKDFAILQFYSHALIDDRTPELSRIVLSLVDPRGRPIDGFLRPYRLAQWKLDGSVVVLSACDTALGKQVLGEGLAGFSSSLFSAGAAQLVLTLTQVDAEATSEFLAETYRHALSGRAGIEHALTLARLRMSQSKAFSDPYYWASFIVVGRPSGPI